MDSTVTPPANIQEEPIGFLKYQSSVEIEVFILGQNNWLNNAKMFAAVYKFEPYSEIK